MNFHEVIRRQRMTRRFQDRAVPAELLDSILEAGQKAPSAGYSQGVSFVVLEGRATEIFWRHVDPQGKRPDAAKAPAILLPLASKRAYLDRYSELDKAAFGLGREENWPVPYWLIDTAFAAMAVLLSATAAGLGCWFFGIFTGKNELLRELGIAQELEPIGAIAIGYPAEQDVRSPSLRKGRKPFRDFVRRLPGDEEVPSGSN